MAMSQFGNIYQIFIILFKKVNIVNVLPWVAATVAGKQPKPEWSAMSLKAKNVATDSNQV